jgi:hypothetical protein
VLATIAVFLAAFKDWRRYLAPGEVGIIMIIAGLVGRPIRKLIEQGGDDGVAASGPEAVWISIVMRFRNSIVSRVSASISLASIGTALSNPVQYRMITRAC